MVTSDNSFKVYHITMTDYSKTIGGIQSFVQILHEGLLNTKIQSEIIALGFQLGKENRIFRAFKIPLLGESPYRVILSVLTAFIFSVRHRGEACVIHAHDMLFGGLAAVFTKFMSRTPFVVTDHGLQSVIGAYTYAQKSESTFLSILNRKFLFSVEKLVAKHADRIMCVGEYSYEYFSQGDVDPTRVKIVRSGIDTDQFKPDRSPFSGDDVVMLYAGRISAEKGIADLIKVFGLLEKEHPELRLSIVGEGCEKETIEEMVKKARLKGKVTLLPMVRDRTDMRNLYNNTDVVVVPSVMETGTPLALLEAMACERVVIVNPSGSLPQIVRNAGVVVPFGNPSKASMLIKSVLDDRNRAIELAKSAREKIVRYFNWKSCFKEIVDTYIDILQVKGRKRS